MGTRAAPKTIAESILDPSAVIMEGFHSVSVLTDEGQVFQGFIKQESGLNVELVQVDGKVVSIPRKSIELRKRQQVSVMPDGLAKQLSPQHVADLIRFILDAGKHPELLQSVSHLSTNLNQKADAPPQFTFGSDRSGIHQNSKLRRLLTRSTPRKQSRSWILLHRLHFVTMAKLCRFTSEKINLLATFTSMTR